MSSVFIRNNGQYYWRIISQMHYWFCTFTGMKMSSMEETPSHVNALGYISTYAPLHNQVSEFVWRLYPTNRAIHITKNVLVLWPSLSVLIRYLAIWFLKREGSGGNTRQQNNNLFLHHIILGHMQSCRTASVTTHHLSAELGRGHIQKMVNYSTAILLHVIITTFRIHSHTKLVNNIWLFPFFSFD